MGRAEKRRAERAGKKQVTPIRTPPAKGGVMVAVIHPGTVEGAMYDSVISMLLYDASQEQLITDWGGHLAMETSPRIAQARCDITREFLEAPLDPLPQWILMIDRDMTFSANALYQLMEVADEDTCPIVSGLCFGGGRSESVFPTIYVLNGQGKMDRIESYPKDTLVKCDATGAAFLMVHRKVFEHMAKDHPDGFGTLPNGAKSEQPWFIDNVALDGIGWGEDIAFCLRARQLGYPVHVHTGVKTGHRKSYELNEEFYEKKLQERDGPQPGYFSELVA